MRSRRFSVQKIPGNFRMSNYESSVTPSGAETKSSNKKQTKLKFIIPLYLSLSENFFSHESKLKAAHCDGNVIYETDAAATPAASPIDGESDQNRLMIYSVQIKKDRLTACHKNNSLFSHECLSNLRVSHDVGLKKRRESCNKTATITREGAYKKYSWDNSFNEIIIDENCEKELLQLKLNNTVFSGLLEFHAYPNELFSAVYFLVVETSAGYFVARVEVGFGYKSNFRNEDNNSCYLYINIVYFLRIIGS